MGRKTGNFLKKYTQNHNSNIRYESNNQYQLKKKKRQAAFKAGNIKGNWPANFYQKGNPELNAEVESKIISGLISKDSFDPRNIDRMLSDDIDNVEKILVKHKSKIKLTKKESFVLDNYLDKEAKLIERERNSVERNLKFVPTTTEAKVYRYLKLVDKFFKESDNELKLFKIYQLLQEKEYNETKEIKKSEHKYILEKLNDVVKKLNTKRIDYQFNELYGFMPPLNQTGFKKLDDFQLKVIDNIRNNISTIVKAPTSAGKTVLSGYLLTRAFTRVLFVMPTDALAWQMSAYVSNIIDEHVPILTLTWKSDINRETLIKKMKDSRVIVGTPKEIADILPLEDFTFDWVVFDEIHMMGKDDCRDYETLAKIYRDTKFLALSATIGNVEDLSVWFSSLGHKEVDVVNCDKRFFNLQRWVCNGNEVQRLNPLSLTDLNDFETKTILEKSLMATPPDVFDLYKKLSTKFDLGDLDMYKKFKVSDRITLDESLDYYNKLIEFMTKNLNEDMKTIINSYVDIKIDLPMDLVDFSFKLKDMSKLPAIYFVKNSYACLKIVKDFYGIIIDKEIEKYPKYHKEKQKEIKANKMKQKKFDKLTERDLEKMMESGEIDELTQVDIDIRDPHRDFIFSSNLNKDEDDIKIIREYFKSSDTDNHYLIDLFMRGVGVYCWGMPDPYLRLVQKYANMKKLSIVFSDTQLVFGVSMPFRTSVIVNDVYSPDDLDSMMYHQMAGRAGRRGLDTEGNVIFYNYSFDRIKELSISKIPNVEGCKYSIWAQNLIGNYPRLTEDILYNNLDSSYSDKLKVLYKTLTTKFNGSWNFVKSDQKERDILFWQLRNEGWDSIRIMYVLDFIGKYFSSKDPAVEANQVELAFFLLNFCFYEELDDTYKLANYANETTKVETEKLKSQLDTLQIKNSKLEELGGKIFESISMNKLLEDDDVLREKLYSFTFFIIPIQHYFYYTKQVNTCRVFAKLVTRLWWIYRLSSPINKL